MAQGEGWLLFLMDLRHWRFAHENAKLVNVSLGTELLSQSHLSVSRLFSASESARDVPVHTHTPCDWNDQRAELLPKV